MHTAKKKKKNRLSFIACCRSRKCSVTLISWTNTKSRISFLAFLVKRLAWHPQKVWRRFDSENFNFWPKRQSLFEVKSDQYVFSFLRKSLLKAKPEGFNGENNGLFILLKNITSKFEHAKLLKSTEISSFFYCSACLDLLALYFANRTELDKCWSTEITAVSVIRGSSSCHRCISLFFFSLLLLFTPLSFSNLPKLFLISFLYVNVYLIYISLFILPILYFYI